MREKCKLDPIACGFHVSDNLFEPLKLMQSVVAQCNEICSVYLDNSLLCSLPPPNGYYHRHPISVCAVKNGRRRMEDRHVVIHDLNTTLNFHEDITPSSYYAVFDGHAGHSAAVYSATHLHQYLGESEYFCSNPEKALTEAYHKTDAYFLQKCEGESYSSGTTAVCALLRPEEKYLYIAWAGDSMALIANKGRILQCVVPHRPSRKDEQDRIERAGGTVVYWGTWRVAGQLAVSRAIGDPDFKPCVIATPDIQKVALDGGEDFIILACDGLWDFVNDDKVAKEVYSIVIKNPEDAEGVSEALVKLAKGNGSTDNISVIVVFLRDPRAVAADAQWLLDTSNTSEGTTSQEDHDTAAAAAVSQRRPRSTIAEAVSEAIRAAAAMDAAAGLDNNATNPFANNDAATTGEHIQKDPFLLDLDSFKQQAADINSVPNNDFFLGLERSTNGKRSAEDVFDDDDFGPESNVDGDGIDILQPQEHINDSNSLDQSPIDDKMNDPEGVHERNLEQLKESFVDDMEEYEQQQMSPTLLAAKAIAEGVNNSNYANPDGLLNRLDEEMDIAMDEFHKGENQFSRDAFEDENVTDKEDAVNPVVPDDVHDGNVADNVADSGEESEDEWNYFKGNTAADTDKENIDPATKTTVDNLEGDDFDMSQLNPNAAEFVPVSPTRNTASPPCMALINVPIYAQSPKRIPAEPVEMDVPEPNDFETEIRSRPSDVCSNTSNRHAERDVEPNKDSSLEDVENYINGKDTGEGDLQFTKSAENFHFGPNATPFSTPAKLVDDSEVFSTNANFGDESTATYLDTTSTFSPDKNASGDQYNNPFGDQADFQTIVNKESDPMSMSFYQDKDDKSDTNPFDLNKVQILPDDLDDFLAKSDEVKVSDLPEQDQLLTTDLDKPSQDEDLLSGVRELPKSPIEDIKTPEPTFDENLCPNNEVIEKENTENVCENIETRNMSHEISELCGQIKEMAMDDTSFTESEIEFKQTKPETFDQDQLIPEQCEEEKVIETQKEPQICVMKMQEETDLIECNMMAPSQFEDQSNQAISPEPIIQEILSPQHPEIMESPQPIIESSFVKNQSFFESSLLSPELEVGELHMEPELIETPVDDITSSIKDDVSPVEESSTELIHDLPLELELTSAPEEKMAPIVETVVAAAAGVAVAAAVAVGSKKALKETPQKKPASSKATATPKSATKVCATSPTKPASKPLSAAKPPTPRPTPISKPTSSAATNAVKPSVASLRPKTAPTSIKSPATKPLLNGEPKATPTSRPLVAAAPKPRVGAFPLPKPLPAKPATAIKSVPSKPLASTRPATAPTASRTTALVKPPSTLVTLSKPKSTATSAPRSSTVPFKLSSATSVTKTTMTVTKTSSTLTSTNKPTAAKTSATVPPKPRAPITRTVPPKAPDAEKQNKENVNKQTASRTTAKTSTLTNGKPTTITRKSEPKVAGITAKTTVSKSTTATTTRLTATKKPYETARPITKSATKTVTKTTVTAKSTAKVNGLQNGLSENTTTTTTTAVENNDLINAAMVVDDLLVKDNSPIMENSQLIDATAAD